MFVPRRAYRALLGPNEVLIPHFLGAIETPLIEGIDCSWRDVAWRSVWWSAVASGSVSARGVGAKRCRRSSSSRRRFISSARFARRRLHCSGGRQSTTFRYRAVELMCCTCRVAASHDEMQRSSRRCLFTNPSVNRFPSVTSPIA